MRAALLDKNKQTLDLCDVDPPSSLGNGDALIKVSMCGLCRSDLKYIDGFLKPVSYPHILGHEISGKIISTEATSTLEKDLLSERFNTSVIVCDMIPCGHCGYCLIGQTNLCDHLMSLGSSMPGGFAEYVKVPIQNLVPTKLQPEAAILADAGATVHHALKKVRLEPGSGVVVIGVGGLGDMAVQLSKLRSSTVIALDIDEEKLAYARNLGADYADDIRNLPAIDIKNIVSSHLAGKLADVVVDLVGTVSSQETASEILAKGGKLLQVGYTANTTLNKLYTKDIVYKMIQIIGSRGCTLYDLHEIVTLAEKGLVKLNVTSRYPLDKINLAIDDLRNGKIVGRAVIIP